MTALTHTAHTAQSQPGTIPTLRRANATDVAGVVAGYLALWGDAENTDCYGTYFDRANPPRFGFMYDGDKLAPIRLMYEHGQDKTIGKTILGRVTRVWKDDQGVAFEAILDRAALDPEIFDRVVGELQRGELGVSSASAEHLAEFEEDGRFKNWLLSEVSLTAWPCERRMPSAVVRSAPPNLPDAPASPPNLDANPVPADADPNAPIGNPDKAGCGCGEPSGEILKAVSEVVSEPVSVTDPHRRGETKPMTTPKAPKRALTLEQLGLQPAATLDEVFAALVEMLGEKAAAAMLEQYMGGAAKPAAKPEEDSEMSAAPMDERLRSLMRSVISKGAEAKPADPTAELRAKVERLEAALNAPAPEPAPSGPALNVQVSAPRRFDGLSYADLAFAYQVLRSKGLQPSEEMRRVLAGRMVDNLEKGDKALTQPEVIRRMPATRANEIMTSTASGAGDEWVSIAWSTNAWEKARHVLILDSLISRGMRVEEIPQGAESIYILGDGSDPTVYTIAQNADVDATSRPTVTINPSRPGTTRHLLTPGVMGARVIYTDVFAENSLLNVAPQLNAQISVTMQEHIEKALLNGDTATGANTNINLIDGTPGTGLSTPYYLVSDGVMKLPLVTTTSLSRDGGTLDDSDFLETLKLLPGELRTRYPQMAFVVDPDTHTKALGMLAVKTESERAQLATINSGMLRNIYGVDVLVSGMMGLANTAGKISGTPGNNTKGRLLAIYAPYWAMGWKRQITIETDRDISAQANIIVATARFGFQYRSATGAAAITYNLTV